MDSKDYHPTPHLVEKMRSRSITWGEILDVVKHPETSYGPDERGRMVHQKDSLSVVASRDGAIITVLLRTTKQWNDEDARNRRDVL